MNDNRYASESELDKLTTKVDKFIESINNLLTSRALHEAVQKHIYEKLDNIEKLIMTNKKNVEERLTILETIEIKRKERERTFKFIFYSMGAIVGFVSSVHVKDFVYFLFNMPK